MTKDRLYLDLSKELLIESYDLHIHSSPSVFPRRSDGLELVKAYNEFAVSGILLKSHYEPTAIRAELINKYSGCKTKAYGGLVLNWPVGGLNVYAVHQAMKAGSKIIWMPTRDSYNSLIHGNMLGDFFDRPGISILNSYEQLKDEVYEIMDVIKKYDGFLATGHLSVEESIVLCREGKNRGVNMILTHPEFYRTKINVSLQKQFANLGVIIEKNWLNVAEKNVTIDEMAFNIREVGAEKCYIATDRGQIDGPNPAEEFHKFVYELLKAGITKRELEFLLRKVPEEVLRI